MDFTTGWEKRGGATCLVIEIGSLSSRLGQLVDRRKARGKRYELWQVCILALMAKLCGEDHIYGMAQWARQRGEVLGPLLGLGDRMPCHNTYRRVLGEWLSTAEFDAQVSAFLRQRSEQSVLIALDGKTLRGTIPPGGSQGVHLLAAYLPDEGVVLLQVAVDGKENEIVAAPRLLEQLDLHNKIVVADALHTQRTLSRQVVAAGGDYIWIVKGNQGQLHDDIEHLFQPESCRKGFSPVPTDFQTVRTYDKGHGRQEQRVLTTSGLLEGYLDWPACAQVFKLERHTCIPAPARAVGKSRQDTVRHEIVYGITSLSPQQADPARLNQLVRSYWQIENGLHYRRDKSLHEDATRCSNKTLAQNIATLNNLVIALIRRSGWRYLPQARRHFAAHVMHAFALLARSPT